MKKNILIATILGSIALVCALLIALMNMVTSPTIKDNNSKKELETCQAIFEEYDDNESVSMDLAGTEKQISKKVLAKDSNGNVLGYLYTVSDKNAYGIITLMVAIKDDKVYQVEFLENGQSFSQTVDNHVHSVYPSSETTDVHLGFYDENSSSVDSIDKNTVENIDTSCGATYGAELVKKLVLIALNDTREVA